ncbi:hypothetical protein [Pseudomonas sp. 3-2]|uniref:hypothetical protein n=1 Tax=Pseudomonas sp. 3-2 TaxID=2867408 RepID=UPI001C8830CD|nr:hypothetical protein [Pseudomonas sp. 3-2]QZD72886.1 hypothetical protein K3819_08450 [Pseudomonas sp. 3-2]
MSKQNQLDLIIEKKSRSSTWVYAGLGELSTLHNGFTALISPEPYQISLHVVAIASCIEALAKACIKILIDEEDSPYLEKARGFKDLTFDFELTKALSRKEITFGDLVSHNIGISGVDQLSKHFGVLFQGDPGYKDLKHSLATIREFVEPPEDFIMEDSGLYEPEYGDLIVSDANALFRDIKDIFASRHIAAHEANFRLVTAEQLLGWFESAMTFANAMYEIIEQKLHPRASRSAFGSSVQAMQNSGVLYSKIASEWESLFEKWVVEWELDNEEALKLRENILESDKSFSEHIDKEFDLHHSRVRLILGNGRRHLEAKIQKMLLETRLEYLKRLRTEV